MIPLLAIIFFADRVLIHVCFDAFIPELVSGPRAIGTIGCLVASFAVAGKQSMHWLDLAAAAAASDVCVADCITRSATRHFELLSRPEALAPFGRLSSLHCHVSTPLT